MMNMFAIGFHTHLHTPTHREKERECVRERERETERGCARERGGRQNDLVFWHKRGLLAEQHFTQI
jgi:hypothetical protein